MAGPVLIGSWLNKSLYFDCTDIKSIVILLTIIQSVILFVHHCSSRLSYLFFLFSQNPTLLFFMLTAGEDDTLCDNTSDNSTANAIADLYITPNGPSRTPCVLTQTLLGFDWFNC